MSTVVAVKKDGVIAIGADSLSKFGRTKQHSEYIKNYSKIFQVGKAYIACVGDAVISHALRSYFGKRKEMPSLDHADQIFEVVCDLHKSLKEDYFLNPTDQNDDDFESSRYECLIASPGGIFGVYALRSVDEFTKFYSFGSGNEFALGAMKTIFPAAAAEDIARAGLEAAAEFDDSTGWPFEIYTLSLS
ncbi:hypothetical protein [Candidatus Formimonas warabiya]|uniref:MFS transporter n=1 Tax=Formimonas warabiya TaxID=1761012 RepID=A0A3G1KN59_FORW1|nr:hypothetical protein [Candidatus Formimonas warabiya]ATW23899.1 hypothetical protein DCMF_03000 [Candidatus Formimonas warabiya]